MAASESTSSSFLVTPTGSMSRTEEEEAQQDYAFEPTVGSEEDYVGINNTDERDNDDNDGDQQSESASTTPSPLRTCRPLEEDVNVDFRGISHKLAAQRLCGALRETLKKHAEFLEENDNSKKMLLYQLCTLESLMIALAGVLLLLDLFLREGCFPWENIAFIIVLFASLGGHLFLLQRRASILKWEAASRMRRALYEFEAATIHSTFIDIDDKEVEIIKGLTSGNHSNVTSQQSNKKAASSTATSSAKKTRLYGDALLRAVQPLGFHCTDEGITSYLTYRSGEWLRLPLHCLVKGDVIALKPEEICPATVHCLDDPHKESPQSPNDNESTTKKNLILPSGYSVPCILGSALRQSSSRIENQQAHGNNEVPDDGRTPGQRARDLLIVNGDVRRFILLETPLGTLMRQRLRTPVRPKPLLILQLESMYRVIRILQWVCLFLVLVASIVRASTGATILHESALITGNFTILIICVFPLALPFLMTVGESWVTAQVLSLQERAILRWKWKQWKKSLSRKADAAVAAGARDQKGSLNTGEVLNASGTSYSTNVSGVTVNQMCAFLHKNYGIDEKKLKRLKIGRRVHTFSCLQWPEGGLTEIQCRPTVMEKYCRCCQRRKKLTKSNRKQKVSRRKRDRLRRKPGVEEKVDTELKSQGETAKFITSQFEEDPPEEDEESNPVESHSHSLSVSMKKCFSRCTNCCRRKGYDSKRLKRKRTDIEQGEWDAGPYKDAREVFIAQCDDVGGVDLYGGLVPREYWDSEYSFEKDDTPRRERMTSVSSLKTTENLITQTRISRPHRERSAPSFQSISKKQWKEPLFSRCVYYFFQFLRHSGTFHSVPALYKVIRGLLQRKNSEDVSLKTDSNGIILGDETAPGLSAPPDVGFGLEPTRCPLLSSQFAIRFGESTAFLCAGRSIVCGSDPVAEHVLFQKGDSGSVIIDLHADDTASQGVRFDDSRWQKYISALKPMGLAAMLNARHSGASALPELTDPLSAWNWSSKGQTQTNAKSHQKVSAEDSQPKHEDERGTSPSSKLPVTSSGVFSQVRKSLRNPMTSFSKMTARFRGNKEMGPTQAEESKGSSPLDRRVKTLDAAKRFSSVYQRAVAVMDADNSTRGLIRLSEAIRDIPVTTWFVNFARSLGFTDHDIDYFAHKRHLYLMSPIPGQQLPPFQLEKMGRDEEMDPLMPTRKDVWPLKNRPLWLNTAMTSTVVRDKRTNKLQMLSSGPLPFVLDQCDEYWDGNAIWPLGKKRRNNILETWRHWQAEDLHCVAVCYDPVSNQETSLFRQLDEAATTQANAARTEAAAALRRAIAARRARRQGKARHSKSSGSLPTSTANPEIASHEQESVPPIVNIDVGLSIDMTSIVLFDASKVGTGVLHADLSTYSPLRRHSSHTFAAEAENRLLNMQDKQIFIGMIASRFQPHTKVQSLIKKLNEAGIRFAYSTRRNYFRTRPLANKMGLETGWNCAISLHDRSEEQRNSTNELLPHHWGDIMLENDWNLAYQGERLAKLQKLHEWDFKAQLPHGLPEIREHLVEKDNVPLLVSLYTDANPTSLGGMIRIMQENGETATVVTSSLDRSTPMLCSIANSSINVEPDEVPGGNAAPDISLKSSSAKSLIQQPGFNPYLRLSNIAASLSASLSMPGSASVHLLVYTMQYSQCCVANWRQALVFLLTMHCILACIVLLSSVFLDLAPAIGHLDALWLTLVMFPLFTIALLSTPPDSLSMTSKRTPFKRDGNFEDFQNIVTPDAAKDIPGYSYTSEIAHCHGCATHPRQGQKFVTPEGDPVEPNPDDYTSEPHPEDMVTYSSIYGPGVFLASHLSEIPHSEEVEYPASRRFSIWTSSTGRRLPVKHRREPDTKRVPFPSRCVVILTQLFITTTPTAIGAIVLYLAHVGRTSSLGKIPSFSESSSPASGTAVCLGGIKHSDLNSIVLGRITVSSLIVLSAIAYSASMMYRSRHIWNESPIKNKVWLSVSGFCVVLQLVYNEVVSSSSEAWMQNQTNSSGKLSSVFPIWLRSLGSFEVSALILWPIFIILLVSLVKQADSKHFEKLMLRLRAYFDTRLGMYSPR